MKLLLVIGVGGFIGSVMRYLISVAIQDKVLSGFPMGTFLVNILGCFAIGMLFAMTTRGHFSPEWRLFLITGICGGFTTFSSFSVETIALLRDGQFVYAFSYIAGSVLIGLLATFSGIAFIKLL